MKKLILIALGVLVLGFTKSFAQTSTYTNPFKGYTHTYNATVDGGGATLTTRWYVATDANGTRATQGPSGDYEITSTATTPTVGSWQSGVGELYWEGTGVYSVDITWGSSLVVNDQYYVFLEVIEDGCTNTMYRVVTISDSNFNVLAYSATGANAPGTYTSGAPGDITGCPDDVTNPLWDGSTHTDPGTTTVIFKVERQNSSLAWDFEYNIDSDGSALSSLDNVTINDNTGNEEVNNTNTTGVVNMESGDDYALVYVTVDNAEDTEIIVDLNIIVSNSLTKDAGNNIDTVAPTEVRYTIKPIPDITGFGGS